MLLNYKQLAVVFSIIDHNEAIFAMHVKWFEGVHLLRNPYSCVDGDRINVAKRK